jgi:Plasmid pRiA4b ORF-3-like protein
MGTRTESNGECRTCDSTFSKRQMARHLAQCAYPEAKSLAAVAQIRVDRPGTPFWLDLDVKLNAPMRELDEFLRNIWLECCDHLSAFEVGDTRYVTVMSDFFFGPEPDERSMSARVSAAVPPAGSTFHYEYDFGSTTELRLKVTAQRQAPSRRDAVRLLARNIAPVWKCNDCDETATSLCAYCSYQGDAFFCEAHAEGHNCGEEAMLPVVNSPRMGVCGYAG